MAVTAHAGKCSSLSQKSALYEKKVKHKALCKMQTGKIKSIRLFHTFCFYTCCTTHPVMWFLLLSGKNAGTNVYVNFQVSYFFQSGGLHKCSHRLFIWMANILPCKVTYTYCTQVQMHSIFWLRRLMGLRLTYLR